MRTVRFKNWAKTLGFSKGYITIFQSETPEEERQLELSEARFHSLWGWYYPSEIPIPEELKMQRYILKVEDIFSDENTIFPDDKIIKTVNSVKGVKFPSIGERLTLDILLEKDEAVEDRYGKEHHYYFKGGYYWKTKAKELAVGEVFCCRGTVKEIKGNTIVLTRCMERKK